MSKLYLVGTPIGNMEDITLRAVRTLREADLIAAEDTRHTRKLLHHFDIHKPLVSYHQHNMATAGPHLVQRMEAGEAVALVTDAGMPGISDPGEDLVRLAIAAGVCVIPIPGPTALTTALVVSGLSTVRFAFEGFLPLKKKERETALLKLAEEERTSVFYEAPHRLLKTLAELDAHVGDRPMVAARELTKLHEEIVRGKAADLLIHFRTKPPRGEFVLVVSGAERRAARALEADAGPEVLSKAVAQREDAGVERKAAMKEVAAQFGLTKRDVYRALLALKQEAE